MRRILRILWVVLGVGAATSCLGGSEPGRVTVAFSPMALTVPTADPGTPMLDGSQNALLDRFPYFLFARVEAEDLEAPLEAWWPETVPEDVPEEVELVLLVPPGAHRQVTVALFTAREDLTVSTAVAPAPGNAPPDATIVSGQDTDLNLLLAELERRPVRGTWTAEAQVRSLAWVDLEAQVQLPTLEAVGQEVTTLLSVGRTYRPRVTLADGTSQDLVDQTLTPISGQGSQEVSLEIAF